MQTDNLKTWIKANQKRLLFLTALVAVAYANTLDNAFVADDVRGILNNPQITTASYIFATPMTILKNILYFVIVQLFGRSPTPFHLMNIIFHLGNVWLILWLVQKIVGDRKTATIAAALTAVHPILTEGVTWISGGQYVRYSFFLLLSLALFILADEKNNQRVYATSLGSFLLALLNSEKAVVFPLILLALVLAFGKIKKEWQKLAPFFALSAVWGILLLGKVGQRIEDVQTTYYQPPQTYNYVSNYTSVAKYNPLVQIPIAISEYLKLIIWPNSLTLYHSEMSFGQGEFVVRALIFLLFVVLLAYGFSKNKQIFFWGTLFVISLLPTLTPLGISWIVAERYVYFGTPGIFVLLALAFKKLTSILGNDEVVYAVLTLILLLLTARTIIRNNDWQNQDTLWLASARTSPSSPQNHNNLGDLYGRRGDLERSEQEFLTAIKLNPNYADAYHNLGNTYQQMGKLDDAIAAYQKAAELNPNLWQSYQNLAAIYFERKEFKKAQEWMEKAVKANPQNPNLERNLEIINTQINSN